MKSIINYFKFLLINMKYNIMQKFNLGVKTDMIYIFQSISYKPLFS